MAVNLFQFSQFMWSIDHFRGAGCSNLVPSQYLRSVVRDIDCSLAKLLSSRVKVV